MASLGVLLLSVALIHTGQSRPAARGGGLDISVGGVRRQRRDLHNLLPYEDHMMSYSAVRGGGGVNNLYYKSDDLRARGLDQALQRLVERDQRREQEEELRTAYLAALLRLLNEVERTGLVGPDGVEVVEQVEDVEEGNPRDLQGPATPDYDEMGMSMGRPSATWWGFVEPRLVQALLDRMEPQPDQGPLQRGRPPGQGESGPGQDQDTLRQLVARILFSIGPNNAPVMSSSHRAGRDLSVKAAEPVSSTRRRARRSLDNADLPSPSNNPPLLRVKRLEDDEVEGEQGEKKLRPHNAELQKMKRIDNMATTNVQELNHGSHRRQRRATLTYDPEILINHILEYMGE